MNMNSHGMDVGYTPLGWDELVVLVAVAFVLCDELSEAVVAFVLDQPAWERDLRRLTHENLLAHERALVLRGNVDNVWHNLRNRNQHHRTRRPLRPSSNRSVTVLSQAKGLRLGVHRSFKAESQPLAVSCEFSMEHDALVHRETVRLPHEDGRVPLSHRAIAPPTIRKENSTRRAVGIRSSWSNARRPRRPRMETETKSESFLNVITPADIMARWNLN